MVQAREQNTMQWMDQTCKRHNDVAQNVGRTIYVVLCVLLACVNCIDSDSKSIGFTTTHSAQRVGRRHHTSTHSAEIGCFILCPIPMVQALAWAQKCKRHNDVAQKVGRRHPMSTRSVEIGCFIASPMRTLCASTGVSTHAYTIVRRAVRIACLC